jgi:hypothetical protein
VLLEEKDCDMTKPINNKKSGSGIQGRLTDPHHEVMLRALHASLPGILGSNYQSSEPLNSALQSQSKELSKKIEALIKAESIGVNQAKLWRQIPLLQFADPNLEPATVLLGAPLYRRFDGRGETKKQPELLMVCDFSVTVKIPRWGRIRLRDTSDSPVQPIKTPRDGITIEYHTREIQLFGNVYPSSSTIGAAAHDLAKLADALGNHLQTDWRTFSDPERRVIVATDDAGMFDLFAGQYNTILCEANGKPAQIDLGWVSEHHYCRDN